MEPAPPPDASFAVPPGHSSTNLFIKHIPESVTDELLEQAMRVFGQLESKKVIRDIHTGRSQEKAFARFTTHEEAERAMRHMVQHGLFGVMPRVEWAQQRYDETITDATRQQRKKLFMRNIPKSVTKAQVVAVAERYGPVEHVTLRDDTQPSRAVTPPCSATPTPASNLQIAFVVYANEGCAAIACDKLYQTYPFPSCGSTPIMTKLAETKKERAVRKDPALLLNRGRPGREADGAVGRSSGDGALHVSSQSSFNSSYGLFSSGGHRGTSVSGEEQPSAVLSRDGGASLVMGVGASDPNGSGRWSVSGSRSEGEPEVLSGAASVSSHKSGRPSLGYRHNPYKLPV